MTTPLTALECDFLACVERLVTACETSATIGTLDEDDTRRTGWFGRLRDAAHSLASGINGGVAWFAERRSELQHAGRTTANELELCEGRRRKVEAELRGVDRGMGQGV